MLHARAHPYPVHAGKHDEGACQVAARITSHQAHSQQLSWQVQAGQWLPADNLATSGIEPPLKRACVDGVRERHAAVSSMHPQQQQQQQQQQQAVNAQQRTRTASEDASEGTSATLPDGMAPVGAAPFQANKLHWWTGDEVAQQAPAACTIPGVQPQASRSSPGTATSAPGILSFSVTTGGPHLLPAAALPFAAEQAVDAVVAQLDPLSQMEALTWQSMLDAPVSCSRPATPSECTCGASVLQCMCRWKEGGALRQHAYVLSRPYGASAFSASPAPGTAGPRRLSWGTAWQPTTTTPGAMGNFAVQAAAPAAGVTVETSVLQPQQQLVHTGPAAQFERQQQPQTQPQTGLVASCGASPLRHTRVISCKTYLKRLNVTQSMSAHLLPLEAGSVRSAGGEPRSAQKGYEPLFRRGVELVDDAGCRFGMVYEGVLCAGQRHLRLTSGWKDFVRAHKLRIGDSVTFERRGEDRTRLHVSVHKQKAWGGVFKMAKPAGAQRLGGQSAGGTPLKPAAGGASPALQAFPAAAAAVAGAGMGQGVSHMLPVAGAQAAALGLGYGRSVTSGLPLQPTGVAPSSPDLW